MGVEKVAVDRAKNTKVGTNHKVAATNTIGVFKALILMIRGHIPDRATILSFQLARSRPQTKLKSGIPVVNVHDKYFAILHKNEGLR